MGTFWKFLKSKFLWINVLIAVILVFVISYLVLLSLDVYTHHGDCVEVPELNGMFEEEARILLKEHKLKYEIIDSVYLRTVRPGEITEQSPAPGTIVKKYRKIYITINKLTKRMVEVPDLVGESKRKAQTNLKALGFDANKIIYKPHEFDGAVLDMQYEGKPLKAGKKLPDGSKIVLVVGRGQVRTVKDEVVVPYIVGLSLSEARGPLGKHRLGFGSKTYDVEPAEGDDLSAYRIYEQSPEAGVVVKSGSGVSVKLSKRGSDNDEEFF